MADEKKPAAPAPAKKAEKKVEEIVRVKATKKGYFGHRIVKTGEVFEVKASEFSDKWMKRTKAPLPKAPDIDEDDLDDDDEPGPVEKAVKAVSDASVL